MVTYVAEHDVLKDDGVLLHKRLRMFGGKSELIQWDGGIHAQVVFPLETRIKSLAFGGQQLEFEAVTL